jgi:putative ABC transport system ATP-binding protein
MPPSRIGAATGCNPATGARIKERPEVPVLDPINLDAAAEAGIAPAVAAVGLARRYGQGATSVDALRGVDLAIGAGEMVAVMGPSGSGKSTLMHLLAGLDRPTAGTVMVAGKDITTLGEKALTRLRRDRIGFVFQGFNLLPTLTAEENVALPIRLAGRTSSADQARILNLLDRVGLADRRRHRPAELSGGQQQRVAVARALVTEPAVVFADEPTGNLDSRSSAEVLQLLRDAASDFGRAVVMVTHDARAAAEADRVLFLADGLLVAEHSHLTSAEILDAMKEIAR